jgi:hypothetical protein
MSRRDVVLEALERLVGRKTTCNPICPRGWMPARGRYVQLSHPVPWTACGAMKQRLKAL